MNYVVVSSSLIIVSYTSDITPVLSRYFFDIQAIAECGFTLKHVSDMMQTYTHMQHIDKYSQHSSNIWPVWLNN